MDTNDRVRLVKGSTAFGYPVSALRTEQRKGRLAVFRVAGKDYVSETAVRDMESKCLTVAAVREPISVPTKDYVSDPEQNAIALAAAMMSAEKLRKSGRKANR